MVDGPNVLVTGGAGYIGSHVCKMLAGEGFAPVTLDNLSRGHRWAVRWGPLVVGDLGDTWTLTETFRQYRPVAVIHFAALAYVGESVSAPHRYYQNNVAGALNVLRACLDFGVHHFVFSSTCATYGVPTSIPIDEEHAQAPVNAYGNTKLAVERMLADFDQAFGIRHVALRYFNAAGADPDGELGEDHEPETHAMPLAIQTALGQRERFNILGTDYPTPDGTAIRDYIHVTDLASAHVLALRHLLAGGESLALNLGTGTGHSVRDLVNSVERVSGRPVKVHEAPRRPGDPPQLVANAALARERLGWAPRFDRIDDIVATALAWHERGHPVGDGR